MAIIKERVTEEASRELFVVGDTVKLIDSPLDSIKRNSKGRVVEIHGDLAKAPLSLVSVQFKVGGKRLVLYTGAQRFVLTKHPKGEPLPDAENPTPNLEDIDEA